MFTDIFTAYHETLGEVLVMNYDLDSKLIDKIVKKSIDGKSYKITTIKNKRKSKYFVNESSIMTFSSVNSLIKYNLKTDFKNLFAKAFYFIVYCHQMTFEELSRVKGNNSIAWTIQKYVIINTL